MGVPLMGSVSRLEQFAVQLLPMGYLHRVGRQIDRQVDIRAGGQRQFFLSEIRTFCTHQLYFSFAFHQEFLDIDLLFNTESPYSQQVSPLSRVRPSYHTIKHPPCQGAIGGHTCGSIHTAGQNPRFFLWNNEC